MRIIKESTLVSIVVITFITIGLGAIGWTIHTTVVKNDVMEVVMGDILTSIYEDKPLTVLEAGFIGGPDIYFGCGYIQGHLEKHPEQKDVLVSRSAIVRRCVE